MRFTAVLVLLLAASVVGRVAAEEPHTTRIETRPYYGAVVTIENGVRVYRPVPPTTHLIVNPDGVVPLAISVNGSPSLYRAAPTEAEPGR